MRTSLAFAISTVMVFSLFSAMAVLPGPSAPATTKGTPGPNPTAFSGTGLPSLDPDDGKFLAVAGTDLETLAGIKIVLYVGLPVGETSFLVGLFDGDVGDTWDSGTTSFSYKLYKDPLKNGTTAKPLDTILSSQASDDDWYDKTYSTDDAAKAPSGNYFYRLEAAWTSGTPSGSYNNFKVRTSGQISVRAGQDFGFSGGPQNAGEPCVGSGDPNPGEQNDPGANSYDGKFAYYFYVPTKLTSITFWDGDNDRVDDTDDPNTPNTDPDGPGPAIAEGANPGAPADNPPTPDGCFTVLPSIYYDILDPQSNLYTNNNPSGNTEWERFIVGNTASNPDVSVSYELQPGLWRYRVQGMDAHNMNVLRSTYEIYSNGDVPYTVNPPPIVRPDHTLRTHDNTTVYYSHEVVNRGGVSDYDLTAVSAHGWAAAVYADTDGDGVLDPGEPKITVTGPMAPNQTMDIIVELKVPDLTKGVTDLMTVTASSRTEWALQGSAKDTTITNSPPVAVLSVPSSVPEGAPVTLDASGSYDPDNDSLRFRWDFEGDGTWDTGWMNSSVGSYTWGDDIVVNPTVQVTDGDYNVSTSKQVTIYNVAPTASVTFDPTGFEGFPGINYSVHVTDPGSDMVTLTIRFDDGTPDRVVVDCNPDCPDPYPSPDVDPADFSASGVHVYGDNGVFTMGITIADDDGGFTSINGTIAISNLPPTLTVYPPAQTTVDEGTEVTLTASASDPGSDDLIFTWEWQYGPTDAHTYYNDGVGPDPYPSPGGTFPFNASDASSFTYGDDGTYTVGLTVEDDDGGSITFTTSITVENVPPTVDAVENATSDEGSLISFTFAFSDPGFDQPAAGTYEDFTATVDWGDTTGDSPTVEKVPGGPGTPTTGTVPASHIYADNGVYVVTVTVCDDDGGCGTATFSVDVSNVPPAVDAGADQQTVEATPLSFTFSFSDPGFDFPPMGTVEDFTATIDWGYGPPESAPVVEVPGGPGVPTTGMINTTHTYGDNGVFTVVVSVCDDDGGCGTGTLTVTIGNVPPVIQDVQAYVVADLKLRVAGEKWHDVRMDLMWNGDVTATARVVRMPGSPDEQSATIEDGRIQVLGDTRIVLYYTPDDDPINGQPNGANPAWVIVTLPDGSEVRFHHTFNVRHEDTWTWTLDDIRPYLVGQEITFNATASDVGSDDLTFAWTWGDGTPDTATTHYNDGIGPDPYPSPEVNPITATDAVTHVFATSGTYTVTLTVTDDDGGTESVSLTISV